MIIRRRVVMVSVCSFYSDEPSSIMIGAIEALMLMKQ